MIFSSSERNHHHMCKSGGGINGWARGYDTAITVQRLMNSGVEVQLGVVKPPEKR